MCMAIGASLERYEQARLERRDELLFAFEAVADLVVGRDAGPEASIHCGGVEGIKYIHGIIDKPIAPTDRLTTKAHNCFVADIVEM